MPQLSGIDSFFLSLESATNLLQVGAVSVLDPSTAPEGAPPPHQALRRVVADRLDRLAPLRRRVVAVPLGLGHPRWVEDEPDLDRHISRAALPAPGDERELVRFAAEVFARPLDRRRPLWAIDVVEGLEDGLVAGISMFHHAAVDGFAGAELTGNLMDLTPEPVTGVAPERAMAAGSEWGAGAASEAGVGPASEAVVGAASEVVVGPASEAVVGAASEAVVGCGGGGRPRDPTPGVLLRQAAGDAACRALPAARMAVRLVGTAAGLVARNRVIADPSPPGLFAAPRTPLAARLGPDRVVGLARVDLNDVHAVRAATRATVNDVVLALTASALRGYLAARGGLPDEPLSAFVPVSVRAVGDSLADGVNRLSGMLVSLATDVADPLVRLAAITEASRVAKEQHRFLGEDLLSELAALVVPAVLRPATRAVRRLRLAERFPPFSVVVSSFAGPSFPLYCGGAELLAHHPIGPVVDGAALNVTAMSYRGQIGFGLLGCRDAVPDIDVVAQLIPESMHQLAKAVSGGGPARARRAGPARRP